MSPSNAVAHFIQQWEKCILTPYKDQAGLWTIGWGHLLPKGYVPKGLFTQEDADELFLLDLGGIGKDVEECIRTQVTQNQYDALVSLAFNIGTEKLARSTVVNLVNQEKFLDAAEWFAPWNMVTVDGKRVISRGLTKRREAERRIFVEADYGGRP